MLRGSSDDEPSPSKSACRKARFTAGELPPDELRDTILSALRSPTISPSTLARSAVEVLDVQLVQHAAGGDRPLTRRSAGRRRRASYAARPAIEVLPVDVVEAGAALADDQPSLTNAPARNAACDLLRSGGVADLVGRYPLQHHPVARTGSPRAASTAASAPRRRDQAEHRVVVRTGQLVALAGAQPQRRVLTGVEELARPDQVAVAVDGPSGRCRCRSSAPHPGRSSPMRTVPCGGPHQGVAGHAIPHGGGGVVAGRAEVAVAVDQRVAQRPRLRHPDQGVVDRRVAVRVVVDPSRHRRRGRTSRSRGRAGSRSRTSRTGSCGAPA